jgi:hypothetical protein
MRTQVNAVSFLVLAVTTACNNSAFLPAFSDRGFSDGAFLVDGNAIHLPIARRTVPAWSDETKNDVVLSVRTQDATLLEVECAYGAMQYNVEGKPDGDASQWVRFKCQAGRVTAVTVRRKSPTDPAKVPTGPIPGFLCLGDCEPKTASMDRYASFIVEPPPAPSAKP